MKKHWSYLSVAWLSILSIGIVAIGLKLNANPKIAYVRSSELVEKFKGMQEAGDRYQKKLTSYQTNVEKLQLDLEKDIQDFKKASQQLSKIQKEKRMLRMREQEKQLIAYKNSLKQKALEEEKIIAGAFNQINSLVEQYAKENGYDVILGTTQEGSLLYGNMALDITEDVLDYLNLNY